MILVKLLWLCNSAPGVVKSHMSGKHTGAVNWVDHVLSGLREEGLTMRLLCRGAQAAEGKLDEKCSYAVFAGGVPHVYQSELEAIFRGELETYQPDVIHLWGVEYGHALAMVNAAAQLGMLDRLAASIQGLCFVIARHYAEGVPYKVQRSNTFRDFLRRDNIARQQEKFRLRGEMEEKTLAKARHVIGRTHWDEACVKRINPEISYHFCNETLREPFYEGGWQYECCKKHRIFASSCVYPVKGFHYLLEAFAEVIKTYPDATLAVPGKSYLTVDGLHRNSYQKYLTALTRQYGLEDRIEFLGSLSAEQMKRCYLESNVFVLPSTIENSPNSLGEAMLLGVPCVAADVGGVTTLMEHKKEGYVYPSTAPYMLAHYIERIFAMEEKAEAMGAAAKAHAAVTHDPEKNLQALLEIYHSLVK